MYDDFPALILSAGRSSRMGFPKALLAQDGEPVVVRLVEKLRQAGWGRVGVIVSDASLRGSIKRLLPSVPILFNAHPEGGMIGSLRIGLEWAGQATGLLGVPVDHPLISTDTLRRIRVQAGTGNVVIPTYCEKRGHPTWWGRSVWDVLRSPSADMGARKILQLPDINVTTVKVNDEMILVNINTKADADYYRLTNYNEGN